jgi:predicted nucleic acid-binding protein
MLFVDSSALVKRYVKETGTPLVLELMSADREWVASALAQTETDVTLCHLELDDETTAVVRRSLADDWERFRVVPVDAACLFRAAEIACAQKVRTLDAIHLAAVDRLPQPVTFLTFDRRQASAAAALGAGVVGEITKQP